MEMSPFLFGLYKLVKLVVYPYTWLCIVTAALAALAFLPSSPVRLRWFRILAVAALVIVWLLGAPLVSTIAGGLLESRYQSFDRTTTARFDAVVVLGAGIVLTFGMWWSYFAMPWGELLAYHRERSFFWGYGHMLIFGSIAATGAGLHAVQYALEDHSELGTTGTIYTVVIPVAVFTLMLYLMYSVSMRAADPFHVGLLVGTAACLGAAVVLAGAGASLATCLVVVALAPLVTVVGYETVGHRHGREHVERLRATADHR